MTDREQWKALRAPVIQRAWDNHNAAKTIALRSMYPITVSQMYSACRTIASRFPHTNPAPSEFGRSLVILTAMRAAEKAGENALIWKLSRP